jgi:hypothetical protein
MHRYHRTPLRVLLLLALAGATALSATARADDFATTVVDYVPGAGIGTDWLSGEPDSDPATALGRPTVDTTGDNWFVPESTPMPVVPPGTAWRAFEIVTVGTGGHLILGFDHPVWNNPDNPFGLDLIVFGNAFQGVSGDGWANGDPAASTMTNLYFDNPGLVSVSQNGTDWFTFANGPFSDTFAPTMGRTYDPANPDPALGAWNAWWGAPTDPTLPLDPALDPGDLAGLTVAEAALLYGGSAGGTGFDIGLFGLDWIQYLRIGAIAGPTQIDAVADVRSLGAPDGGVPEPGTALLLGTASAVLLGLRRRRA